MAKKPYHKVAEIYPCKIYRRGNNRIFSWKITTSSSFCNRGAEDLLMQITQPCKTNLCKSAPAITLNWTYLREFPCYYPSICGLFYWSDNLTWAPHNNDIWPLKFLLFVSLVWTLWWRYGVRSVTLPGGNTRSNPANASVLWPKREIFGGAIITRTPDLVAPLLPIFLA